MRISKRITFIFSIKMEARFFEWFIFLILQNFYNITQFGVNLLGRNISLALVRIAHNFFKNFSNCSEISWNFSKNFYRFRDISVKIGYCFGALIFYNLFEFFPVSFFPIIVQISSTMFNLLEFLIKFINKNIWDDFWGFLKIFSPVL